LKEEIVIKSHMLRELNKVEWEGIKQKIGVWREKFEDMELLLKEQQRLDKAV
jgi:hypothetical protein